MSEFKLCMAGCVIAARTLYESTKEYCAGFLCEGAGDRPADLSVEVCREDIDAEAALAARIGRPLKGSTPEALAMELEPAALHRRIVLALLERDTLLLHASALALDGEAYLFAAPSGTGKSTHAALWRECFGSRVTMINDDKPLLRITEREILVCGSPFNGKHGLSAPICVPLKALCILEQGERNRVRAISSSEALTALFHMGRYDMSVEELLQYIRLLDRLTAQVPCYRMECNTQPEAAYIARIAMK